MKNFTQKHIVLPTIFLKQRTTGNLSLPTPTITTVQPNRTQTPQQDTATKTNPETKATKNNETAQKCKKLTRQLHQTTTKSRKPWHLSTRNLTRKRARITNSRTRLYNEKQPRITTIADKYGLRTLTILSINPDNLITSENKKTYYKNYRAIRSTYHRYKKHICHMTSNTQETDTKSLPLHRKRLKTNNNHNTACTKEA